MRITHRLLAAAALTVTLPACGGDDDASAVTSSTAETTAAATTTTGGSTVETAGPPVPTDPPDAPDTPGDRPVVEVPEGAPPTELQIEDILVGNGAEATTGGQVTVHYVGVSWSTGAEFDASWDSGTPFSFTLGNGDVIAGWDQGVAGMKVGGRRRLVIPPDLGYGDTGAGELIGPGETLVFVVDLLSVG